MIRQPMDVLTEFPVRKSCRQKKYFRSEVADYAQKRGYSVCEESGSFGAKNLVIGDPEQAKYLVTAHYDTPASIGIPNFVTPCNFWIFLLYQILTVGVLLAVSFGLAFVVKVVSGSAKIGVFSWYIIYFGILFLMMMGPANRHNANDNTSGVVTVLEIMTSLPADMREQVCFVLFDLEEAGLIGSASYSKLHKSRIGQQTVINLDCVGDGDVIMLFPNPKAKKNTALMDDLEQMCRTCGDKEIRLHRKGFAYCPSDHKNFPNAVGVMAFRQKRGVGLYCSRIHTWRDTILEQTNVNILRAAIISMICHEKGE